MNCTKWPKYIPNGNRIYQPFPFQDPSKFTQIGTFGLKMYHLAPLFYVSSFNAALLWLAV
jgi:hypothetical protein